MKAENFKTHGVYTVSNAISYLIELSDCGDSARMIVGDKITDWYEIEYVYDEDSDDMVAVIDPSGYNVPLNLVMRLEQSIGNVFTCVICEEQRVGYGNNPEPVKNEGKCCDGCNFAEVITARIKAIQ